MLIVDEFLRLPDRDGLQGQVIVFQPLQEFVEAGLNVEVGLWLVVSFGVLEVLGLELLDGYRGVRFLLSCFSLKETVAVCLRLSL